MHYNHPSNPTFSDLYSQCNGRLLNSMTAITRNRENAEDITAAAFEKALEHMDSFRGESSFYTWLHTIALNEARSLRKRAVSLESIDGPHAKDLAEPDVPARTLERSECCSKIQASLRQVPAIYRRTLVDRFVRGHSIRQIARRHKVPFGTVLSRLFAGKRLLREAWEA